MPREGQVTINYLSTLAHLAWDLYCLCCQRSKLHSAPEEERTDMPYRKELPAWRRELGTPRSFTTRDGCIHFHFDLESFDFHIDASPGYRPSVMGHVLNQLTGWGLELMTYDECDVEFLEHGVMRIYLTPIVPPETAVSNMVEEFRKQIDALTEITDIRSLEATQLDPELHGDPEPGAPEQLGAA
ncbi:hypothetical protein Joe_33 [Streptomyces phage Joe]|uniref:Uncharacterized protein n=1 Tax=Streptomyces phage Joe TaxID=1913034 RepID=A0A1J0GQ97_9CAUD|nr:hypothetical protein KGG94_gp33 [Streptomyces phage Joe]APC43273.1 hypothetical protein Joe_33 [Streptomyces phage Joe]